MKNRNITSLKLVITILILMFPHVLIYFNRTNINLSGIISLSIMFGLPFALMQRKQDLVSAIGAHAIVDLIRFAVLGV